MSKQNKSTQVGNRIILNGTALLLLAYMLAKIVYRKFYRKLRN